ncbi:MAG: Xaa-Pro peptidase family protein [Fimbriimonadaceae bacterium]|nr:Xaa-Pro peptidase family protein [Fimbriimonadaceae bacterium]
MTQPLHRLRSALAAADVPALLVNSRANVRWLTGFSGSFGMALVTAEEAVFITDSRYAIQAGEQVVGLPVVSFGAPKTMKDVLAEQLASLGVDQIAFETSNTFAQVRDWERDHAGVAWIPAPNLLAPLRQIKTESEVEKIRAACRLADATLEHLLPRIQPGVAEMDVQIELEFYLRRQGSSVSFEPIVVSGPNSARPHGKATDRRLQSGDFLTIDMGAWVDGYASDITRTFVIGRADDRHREVYGQVLEAQLASIEALKPGTTGVEVDRIAREALDRRDLARHFGHGLGHGLGLEVHDPGSLSPRSQDSILPGQVWTIEPGVYIEGYGGVRIEDDVLVTETGNEILTSFPKDLMELG